MITDIRAHKSTVPDLPMTNGELKIIGNDDREALFKVFKILDSIVRFGGEADLQPEQRPTTARHIEEAKNLGDEILSADSIKTDDPNILRLKEDFHRSLLVHDNGELIREFTTVARSSEGSAEDLQDEKFEKTLNRVALKLAFRSVDPSLNQPNILENFIKFTRNLVNGLNNEDALNIVSKVVDNLDKTLADFDERVSKWLDAYDRIEDDKQRQESFSGMFAKAVERLEAAKWLKNNSQLLNRVELDRLKKRIAYFTKFVAQIQKFADQEVYKPVIEELTKKTREFADFFLDRSGVDQADRKNYFPDGFPLDTKS